MSTTREMIREYSRMKDLNLSPSRIEELLGYQLFKLSKERSGKAWKIIFKIYNWIDEKFKLSSPS